MNKRAVISEVIPLPENGQTQPLLLDFENGSLTAGAHENVAYKISVDNRTEEQEAVVAVNGSIYHGPVKGGKPSDLINTFIAVRSAKTNKVRLIQVQQATLINAVFDKKELPTTQQSRETSKALMIKNFGGRSANKALDQTLRTQVDVDIVKEQLNKTVEQTIIEKDEEIKDTFENSIATIRPPLNNLAKRLEDVYSLHDVIPAGLMARLNEEVDSVLMTKMEDLPIQSKYIRQRIEDIKNSGTPKSDSNTTKIKALIYLEALGNLVKLPRKHMKKVSLSEITEKVENDIRARFSHPDLPSKIKTTHTTDKAICYYLVLSLLTSPEYKISISVVKDELSLPQQKLATFAQAINAKLNLKKGVLQLQLPGVVKSLKPTLHNRRNNRF